MPHLEASHGFIDSGGLLWAPQCSPGHYNFDATELDLTVAGPEDLLIQHRGHRSEQ